MFDLTPLKWSTPKYNFLEEEHNAEQKYKPEDIVSKLRQVDVLLPQGQTATDAIRQIGVRAYISSQIHLVHQTIKYTPSGTPYFVSFGPPHKNRKIQILYDKTFYKQRHKIENIFGRLKDCAVLPSAITAVPTPSFQPSVLLLSLLSISINES